MKMFRTEIIVVQHCKCIALYTLKWLILYYVNFTSILKNELEGYKWMHKTPFTEVQMRHDHLNGDTGDKETEPQDVFGGRPNKS